jgi:hypothetical protein
MKTSSTAAAEAALARLLDVLATILLPLDITPSRLAQLARTSFVKASVSAAGVRSSGRPHIARIAALTGLSRVEVKKIVDAQFMTSHLESEHAPRALRVLHAWQSSNMYARRGHPKALRITGTSPSFESLCKQFSGDIPHKVILDELKRRRLIRLTKSNSCVTLSRTKSRVSGSPESLASIEYVSALLLLLSKNEDILVRRTESILASSEIPEAYIEQAIAERMNSVLDSLPSLFAQNRRKSRTREIAQVFTLVARAKTKN